MKNIDHVVYCVQELDSGVDYLNDLLGVDIIYGGRHLNKGTHNALFRIGPNSYFEVLSPDPENHDVAAPRWMGIDLIKSPTITRWAIQSEHIHDDAKRLESYRLGYGQVENGSRQKADGEMLSWQLTHPLSEPAIEVVPFLLNWNTSIHPSTELPLECELESIKVIHDDPSYISDIFQAIAVDAPILKGAQPRIEIVINTPNGLVTLT